jgi:nucleotide-binding universal stress UspA family protein
MKILICFADIPQTETTVWRSSELVRLIDSQLTLLHVAALESDLAIGETILEKAADLFPDAEPERRVRRGDPADEIVTEIAEGAYDLVVIGANQKASLTEQILGSVALRITRQSPISVLVTKGQGLDLSRILICTSGVDIANPAIETGAWLAQRAETTATLLHVISPAPRMYTGLKRIEESLPSLLEKDTPLARHLRQGAETLSRYGIQGKLEIRYGTVAEEIVKEITEGNYGLVIIGPTGAGVAGRLRKWLLGDMTREIVERAPCSILVIRNSLAPPAD